MNAVGAGQRGTERLEVAGVDLDEREVLGVQRVDLLDRAREVGRQLDAELHDHLAAQVSDDVVETLERFGRRREAMTRGHLRRRHGLDALVRAVERLVDLDRARMRDHRHVVGRDAHVDLHAVVAVGVRRGERRVGVVRDRRRIPCTAVREREHARTARVGPAHGQRRAVRARRRVDRRRAGGVTSGIRADDRCVGRHMAGRLTARYEREDDEGALRR
jgi:hypothetical protein